MIQAVRIAAPDAVVVIVAGYPSLGRLLAHYLWRAGYERAEYLDSARQCIAWLAKWRAHLVLVDFALEPRDSFSDGVQAARVLAESWPELRVAVVTGYGVHPARIPEGMPLVQRPLDATAFVNRVGELLKAPPWVPRPLEV